MPGSVRYQTKPMQSGFFLVRSWTEIMDVNAGISFVDADAQQY